MSSLPNYQNVALKGELPFNRPPGADNLNPNIRNNGNHFKGNVAFVSERDRRLAERERERRGRKGDEKKRMQEEYVRSLAEPPARPSGEEALPGFQERGVLDRAAPRALNGDRDMGNALRKASEHKSRRDQAYEEKVSSAQVRCASESG